MHFSLTHCHFPYITFTPFLSFFLISPFVLFIFLLIFSSFFFLLFFYIFLSFSSLLTGIDNVETFFGTAPVIWNRLFTAMANLIPQAALKNVDLMNKFALFSLPMVRLVDMLVGCTNGMRYAACVCVCVCICVCISVCLCACVCVFMCIYMCVYVYTCLSLTICFIHDIIGIRVDVTLKNGEKALGLLTHASLEKRYVNHSSSHSFSL